MKNATAQNRIVSIDLLKLFAIFLVILGHVYVHLQSGPVREHDGWRFIYSFHMTLFMAVSGFFAPSLLKLDLRAFFVKKGMQLLVPAVFTTFAVAGLMLAAGEVVEKSYYVNGIWFLKSLFACSLLYLVSARLFPNSVVALSVSLVFSQIVPYFSLPSMYPAFVCGSVLRQLWPWFTARRMSVIIMSGLLFACSFVLIVKGDTFETPSTGQSIRQAVGGDWSGVSMLLSHRYVLMATGVAGTLFFFMLFDALFAGAEGRRGVVWLSRFGQRTLGVYIIQTFVLEFGLRHVLCFDGMDTIVFSYIAAPLLSMAVLALCLWIAGLMEGNRVTALLFLGQHRPR